MEIEEAQENKVNPLAKYLKQAEEELNASDEASVKGWGESARIHALRSIAASLIALAKK
jgi:hypothetical protein